jgi:hypothetical protein
MTIHKTRKEVEDGCYAAYTYHWSRDEIQKKMILLVKVKLVQVQMMIRKKKKKKLII